MSDQTNIDRRDFLKITTALCAAAALWPVKKTLERLGLTTRAAPQPKTKFTKEARYYTTSRDLAG